MHIYQDPNHAIVIERSQTEREYCDTDAIQTNDYQTSSGIIDLFVDCIVRDTVPAIGADDVLPAMRGTFACEQSAQHGGMVVEV